MPYVYKVTHKKSGEFYIGSKYAVGATPENTSKYFGTPKGKTARCSRFKFILANENDMLDKTILGVFDTKKDALDFEMQLHRRLFDDPLCLNGAKQTSTKFSASFEKEEHPSFGKTHTLDSRQKMRLAKLGKPRGSHSLEHREKIKLAQIGRKLTEEHKAKLRLAKVGATRKTIIVECPHCKKQGCSRMLSRYHFDKCKHKEVVCQS